MIGMILTGHGEFAPGLAHALQMIAGEQTAFKVVAFKEDAPIEDLEKNMQTAINELLAEVEQVVIFSDLLGGSPFKAAMMASNELENVEVICGTNLPMLIESAMMRQFMPSASELANQAITTGQAGVQVVQFPNPANNDPSDNEDEDGI
ncbi:PTS system, N-acetylgalactosamine-specific IIA component [Granulicatella balaenopterae]|uniref:PTS system, N-acetylgalactosamine-specific IIA component n=1 Tax=Granulicatella balaenopterae TaxID=137733 RepID=A0A1H9LTL6_9LACT|nr:PTS galactosamine/N-acetylgalactosamine transporter subunit IIA [Granulicatella balaenopterae]SER14766.1 PTS system, N-acetylgalactosamine-specific IIA component [Granulicatella balaenopterae]